MLGRRAALGLRRRANPRRAGVRAWGRDEAEVHEANVPALVEKVHSPVLGRDEHGLLREVR
jgi:hypothetical protein